VVLDEMGVCCSDEPEFVELLDLQFEGSEANQDTPLRRRGYGELDEKEAVLLDRKISKELMADRKHHLQSSRFLVLGNCKDTIAMFNELDTHVPNLLNLGNGERESLKADIQRFFLEETISVCRHDTEQKKIASSQILKNYLSLNEKKSISTTPEESLPKYVGCYTEEVCEAIESIWLSAKPESKKKRFEAAVYFYKMLDSIRRIDYIPSFEDILRYRRRKYGLTEMEFKVRDDNYSIIDVGQQKGCPSKWMGCFQEITGILFVVSLTGFNKSDFDENNVWKNELKEAFLLLKSIGSYFLLKTTPIVIMFTNAEDFADKLRLTSIRICSILDDFEGEGFEDSTRHIVELFTSACENLSRCVYTQVVDESSFSNFTNFIHQIAQDIIIRRSMIQAGMLQE